MREVADIERCVPVGGYGGAVGGVEAGGVGGDVGGGNRTLIETFLLMVDLIRARIESIPASRIQESTTFIRA